MLEAQALDGVGEFDIDAEVVGIQFQFVAVQQAASWIDVHGQCGDRAVERQFPVAVAGRVGLEIDHVAEPRCRSAMKPVMAARVASLASRCGACWAPGIRRDL